MTASPSMSEVPLESLDRKLRVLFLLGFIVAAIVAVVLLNQFEDRSIATRTAAIAVPSTLVWWLISNMHLWDPDPDQRPTGPTELVFRRRRGNVPAGLVDEETWLSAQAAPQPYPAGSDASADLDVRNSALALVGSSALAGACFLWADFARDVGSVDSIGLYSSIAIAPALAYAARSAFRLLFRRRAVHVDRTGITLGMALGYVPPVHLPRTTIVGVARVEDRIRILLADRRIYELNRTHLVGVDELERALGLSPAS